MMRRFLATLCALAYLVSATTAQAGFLINSFQFVTAGEAKGYSYTTTLDNDTSATTHTMSAVDFGAADANRKIIVVCASGNTADISSATIGGEAATVQLDGVTSFGFYASVASGTSGDVVINWAASEVSSCSIYRAISMTHEEISTENGCSTTTNCAITDLNVTTGGFAIALVNTTSSGTVTQTFAWNGVDTPTERTDGSFNSASNSLAVADVSSTETATTGDWDIAESASSSRRTFGWSWQ